MPVRLSGRDTTKYFYIDQILKDDEKRFLSILCLLPFATLGSVLLFYSDTLISALISYILASFGLDSGPSANSATANTENTPGTTSLHADIYEALPNSILPAIVLLLSWLIVGARISEIQARIENGIIYLFRIRQQVHEFVTTIAELILKKRTFADTQALLNVATVGQVRLPRELVGAPAAERLAYQLLEVAKTTIPEYGTREAVLFRANLYFPDAVSHENQSAFAQANVLSIIRGPVYRIFTIFFFVSVCYAGLAPSLAFVPLAGEILSSFKVVWPEYGALQGHLREIGVRAVGGVLPTIAALLYIEYRWDSIHIMRYAGIFTVSIIVFAWCGFVNLVNSGILLIQISTETGGFEITHVPNMVANLLPELYYAIAYSGVPTVCTFVMGMVIRNGHLNTWAALLGAFIFGAGFFWAQWTFESAVDDWTINYFWHQGLLGFVLGCGGLLPVSLGRPLRHVGV